MTGQGGAETFNSLANPAELRSRRGSASVWFWSGGHFDNGLIHEPVCNDLIGLIDSYGNGTPPDGCLPFLIASLTASLSLAESGPKHTKHSVIICASH